MSLWKGNKATDAKAGSRVEAGAYKFKIEEAKHYADNMSIGIRMTLWDGEGQKVTDKFWDFIKIDPSAKDAIKAETDRRLQILIGSTDLDSEKQLLGKSGHVVVRASFNNGEVTPWGGYYDKDRKSVNGNETMSETLKQALEYNWRNDEYAVRRYEAAQAASGKADDSVDTEQDMPF